MALNDSARALARVPFLAVLEPDAIKLVAFSAEGRTLRVGDVLFHEGDAADSAYLVLSGALDLISGRPPDENSLRAEAGALIGETALVRSTLRPATAVATEPVRLLRLSRAMFHRVLAEHPRSAVRLRAFVAQRLSARLADVRTEDPTTD